MHNVFCRECGDDLGTCVRPDCRETKNHDTRPDSSCVYCVQNGGREEVDPLDPHVKDAYHEMRLDSEDEADRQLLNALLDDEDEFFEEECRDRWHDQGLGRISWCPTCGVEAAELYEDCEVCGKGLTECYGRHRGG